MHIKIIILSFIKTKHHLYKIQQLNTVTKQTGFKMGNSEVD